VVIVDRLLECGTPERGDRCGSTVTGGHIDAQILECNIGHAGEGSR
jgi:hypothetical protein